MKPKIKLEFKKKNSQGLIHKIRTPTFVSDRMHFFVKQIYTISFVRKQKYSVDIRTQFITDVHTGADEKYKQPTNLFVFFAFTFSK